MTQQRNQRQTAGIVFLSLSLVCVLVFAILSANYTVETDPHGETTLSLFGVDLSVYVESAQDITGVDLYAFVKTAAVYFAVAVICLLGAFFGVMSIFYKLPFPLRLGGCCAAFLNVGLLLMHIFKHGEFLFTMLEAL